MKKHLLLTALFCLTNLLAQNKIAEKVSELQKLNADFKAITVLSSTQHISDKEVSKVVDGATLAILNLDEINGILSNKYGTIELQIPYRNQNIPVLLYKVDPFAEGFHLDTDNAKNISYQNGIYYRGIIKGETNSVAAFNFFNGEFNGVISSSKLGNLVVGKLDKENNQSDYIVYSDAEMKVLHEFECHIKDNLPFTPKNAGTNRDVNSLRCVSFYFEVDYNIYQGNGSNLTTTTNWITSVFNNVKTLYNNDGISVGLKSIFIWTTPDPYATVAMTSIAHLNAFVQNRPVFDGDIGMLVGIDPQPAGTAGLGGIAYLDTLCTSNNYAYVDADLAFNTVPTYSWTIEAITHEFGHSMGSPHTHGCYWNGNSTPIDGCGQQVGYFEPSQAACPTIGPIPSSGTIMSYCHLIQGVGINFNNGFGPQPAALILNNVNSSTCLSADCATSCPNTVSEIQTSNITSTSVNISWTDIGTASSWQVAVTIFSSSVIVWNTVTTNSYTVTGLTPNTYYTIRVRPFCPGMVTTIKEKIFATNATNFCNNVAFTDTGGPLGNYSNLESWVRTMTPNNPGLKINVNFSSFNLETNWDYLYIYDGPTEFYPEITGGGLTGNGNLFAFTSSSTEGSLTFRFYSDQGTTAPGWSALITCSGPLGVEDNDFLDYSYYPNPTTGNVAIVSRDAITEVAVYNVQGQLLFNHKVNQLSTNVDISQFAKGTYFFKLKINEKEVNFKILKM
jgi:hypothetical protein